MIASYDEFLSVYGPNVMSPTEFNRFEYEAEVTINDRTTGIDGVAKLRAAFPIDPDDTRAVKRCVLALTLAHSRLFRLEEASASVEGGIAKSKSSGSESITYQDGATALQLAARSPEKRSWYLDDIVRRYLGGRTDANGVNLLYGGPYPGGVIRA